MKIQIILSGFALVLSWSLAHAQDGHTGLPGVQAQTPIVSAPPPEPDRDNAPRSLKHFRVGNTDVTVSGSVTVDVGTSGRRSR